MLYNVDTLIRIIFFSYNMSKRVTVVIDDDLDKKLRLRQAKLIQAEQGTVSFSRAVNEVLRKGLK